jgi:tRNA dimethylallyltransferase
MEISGLITILGPTAVGKTRLAALLANRLNGEIISADSRQVYKGMTLGTGKDLDDYTVNGKTIPYHLIDVAHPNEEFHVFRFKKLFIESAKTISQQGNQIIMCGGTGLYLDAVLRDYFFVEVPENIELRKKLQHTSLEELAQMLTSLKKVHNKTNLEDRNRLLRALEIHEYHQRPQGDPQSIILKNSRVFGVNVPREIVRQRISHRLENRLHDGMIAEVEQLMQDGVTTERLLSFGLEYKYVTLYLTGKMEKDEMTQKLCTAIHQFAKRQMSWFRRMERLGVTIEWIDGTQDQHARVEQIIGLLES